MKIRAKLRNLRIAPRKVRLTADLIRGKKIEQAQKILNFTVKKATKPLLKLLNSAVSNAKHNFQMEPTNLYVSKITVDEGPKYKRWMARARGAAGQIQKKTSHITLVLDEVAVGKKRKKIKEVKKPEKIEPEKIDKKSVKKEAEKPKFKTGKEAPKPKINKGIIKRIFRRKAF